MYAVFMIGVDEVGRGCLAGPLLVVAARQINDLPNGLADSKVLNRSRREELFELVLESCDFGEGWVKPHEIDKRGLTGAMKLGVKRAFKQLSVGFDEEIIMDGPINYFSRGYKKVQCLIDADAIVPLVSAASIYAKVKRDLYMIELAKRHPKYNFHTNVGYGTPEHLQALDIHGSLKKVHRHFFEPVARTLQEELWPQSQ